MSAVSPASGVVGNAMASAISSRPSRVGPLVAARTVRRKVWRSPMNRRANQSRAACNSNATMAAPTKIAAASAQSVAEDSAKPNRFCTRSTAFCSMPHDSMKARA
jgi:hypothetical protein